MIDKKRILKCGNCDTELKTIKTTGRYLGYEFSVELEGCENCGWVYVSEELVETQIARVEAMLEGK